MKIPLKFVFPSNLEKATKEISPQDDLIDPKLLVPAFAASMIANLLMGGHILSQVRFKFIFLFLILNEAHTQSGQN